MMRTPKWTIQFLALLWSGLFVGCNRSADGDLLSDLENAPQVLIDGVQIELLAKEPDIVTPTGVQVDDQNRIWVIENHTHVRQDDYSGPEYDRILVFSGHIDSDSEKQITEFARDFTDGMSISFTRNGKVLLITRASIIQFTDHDGDNVADDRDILISLETEEDFPHNGMSGLVVSPDGKIYFQCGENFGAPYKISGSDGTMIIGKEREGGSLYRCNMDGSNLERIGTAIWNCFAMTFDPFGNLFAVENDPDSRPPCRLLHIVKGGNYGFQFQHGRDGLSPLTSWFGQIPGTLPMVAGTGEAPSGVLFYEQDKLGNSTQGSLLVTSWGDNEIQSFQLKPKESSFTAEAQSFVKGQRDFYPVGLALDNNAGVIVTDWASVSYAVHGQGRIWRVSSSENDRQVSNFSSLEEQSKQELMGSLNARDSRVRAVAADLVISKHGTALKDIFRSNELSDRGKMNLLWSAQLNNHSGLESFLELALDEENDLLRAAAVRMIIEQNIISEEQFFIDLIKSANSPFVIREAIYGLSSRGSFESVVELFGDEDPFIHTALIHTFGKPENVDYLLEFARSPDSNIRLGSVLCLRRSGSEKGKEVVPAFLSDQSTTNRITVLKWIAEDNLKSFRGDVEESFSKVTKISPELFDAYVVTFQYLDGAFNQDIHFMEGDEHVKKSFYKRQKFLLTTASNTTLNYEIRSRALSAINPNHADLDVEVLEKFAQEPNSSFQIETIRSLNARTGDDLVVRILQQVAADANRGEDIRLEAIVGLANSARNNKETRGILLDLLQNESTNQSIRDEATRSLESIADDPEVTPWIEEYKKSLPDGESAVSEEFWRELGQDDGNSIAGARTFFSTRYLCSSCHRINGRGGIFGPDLSQVGSNSNRERILESVLNPDDIISPAYSGYSVTTQAKETVLGRLDEDLDSKRHLQMILANGKRMAIPYDEIAEQNILPNSLMPANLYQRMTADEFRDLIQFLAELN